MGAYPRRSSQRGVTLMELVVVVVVVAILAAVAIPAFRQHALRMKRTDAKRELLMLADQLERCRKHTSNYTRLDDVPHACIALPYTNPEGTYRITGAISSSTFQLTATPQGGQVSDAACGAFTLDQLGQHGITGNGAAAECWGDHQK